MRLQALAIAPTSQNFGYSWSELSALNLALRRFSNSLELFQNIAGQHHGFSAGLLEIGEHVLNSHAGGESAALPDGSAEVAKLCSRRNETFLEVLCQVASAFFGVGQMLPESHPFGRLIDLHTAPECDLPVMAVGKSLGDLRRSVTLTPLGRILFADAREMLEDSAVFHSRRPFDPGLFILLSSRTKWQFHHEAGRLACFEGQSNITTMYLGNSPDFG